MPVEECKIPEDLTEEQVQRIAKLVSAQLAEAAADRAVAKLKTEAYTTVGKGVVGAAIWVIGAIVLALFFYGASHGWIKPPSP